MGHPVHVIFVVKVTAGIKNLLRGDDIFDCKPAVDGAFHFAKDTSPIQGKHGPEYIEICEFRLFLATLRQYFEYYQAFARIDSGDDNRVSKEEFANAKETIEKWVGPIEDIDAGEFVKALDLVYFPRSQF